LAHGPQTLMSCTRPVPTARAEPSGSLRRDAMEIWQAGLDAVLPRRLVPNALRVEGPSLVVGNQTIPLGSVRRIAVVGAGKAGAGMAEAVEGALGPSLLAEKRVVGWVNVPADCVRPLACIHLHAARPAGVNEPTPQGAAGTAEILRIVESLGPDDLCLCLISGGGSALLPAPVEGVSLADKIALTRYLSASGATIEQLNAVRRPLSRVKGGGLCRACRAGRMISLVISDVLGDPLDMIASGPTVAESQSESASSPARAALDVLEHFGAERAVVAPAALAYLRVAKTGQARLSACDVTNIVIGNNATAVTAAAEAARGLGYATEATSATRSEGAAEDVGRALARKALQLRDCPDFRVNENGTVPFTAPAGSPACLVSGGEPVVRLVEASRRGSGGRNQQLALAAAAELFATGAQGIALLSGGTDGEDGPTDAAGAVVDAELMAVARRKNLDPADFLARNDAYHFFDPLDALLRTGPTQTNVCDVRVVLVQPSA
jgi:glycerate 2-kinase